jgi:hypothetical protein
MRRRGEFPRARGNALFGVWFAFCALLALAVLGGLVWLVIELLPHITGALDRAGQ